MAIKKLIVQLEKHINVKLWEYQARFYSNRRNFYIHMGLDQSLFSFQNFRKLPDNNFSWVDDTYKRGKDKF